MRYSWLAYRPPRLTVIAAPPFGAARRGAAAGTLYVRAPPSGVVASGAPARRTRSGRPFLHGRI